MQAVKMYTTAVCPYCIRAKQILKTRDTLNRILADHCGQELSKIEIDTERDYYMSAEEAKAYGIIDQVISKESR